MLQHSTRKSQPMAWVPSLYFAQGLPNYTVCVIAVLLYQSLGSSNDQIAHWTGLLTLAWGCKALWSPLVERVKQKKRFVIAMQCLGGGSLIFAGLALQLPHYFAISMVFLGIVALASATHDIAADGLYMASLNTKQQASFAGWQGGFYNAAKFVSLGALPILQSYLAQQLGASLAWSIILALIGGTLLLVGAYHHWTLPNPPRQTSANQTEASFIAVFKDFLQKPGVWLGILFILLFRAGEAQLTVIGPLFLRDTRAAGGLGLTMAQFGQYYGVGGSIAFICGTILGGYFAAWLGLRRAIPLMIIAMNLPNLTFYYLSVALPDNPILVISAICLEMFGFGFGFVAIILFIMQILAPGKYQTAHYAFGTALMALGYSFFRTISGDIQMALGYQQFFLWVLLAAIPVFLLSFWVVPVRGAGERC